MTRPAPIRLDFARAMLLVVDLQERLLPIIHEHEVVVARSAVMIRAARTLGLPIVWTEQYRKGLGPTVEPIVEALAGAAEPLEKLSFGCFGDPAVLAAARATGREQLVICGIEAHVCVLQTALHGLELGWQVFVPHDGVGSRRPADRDAALDRMTQAGVVPASVEMLIMEALGVAGGETFKAILPLLKD